MYNFRKSPILLSPNSVYKRHRVYGVALVSSTLCTIWLPLAVLGLESRTKKTIVISKISYSSNLEKSIYEVKKTVVDFGGNDGHLYKLNTYSFLIC